VRAVEELVQQTIHREDHEPLSVVGGEAARPRSPRRSREHSAALEQELRTALGTKVELKQRAGGRGRIVIHFSSPEEFERLRDHLCAHLHSKAG
jgi:ParB family chromosome partitioning protein